MIATRLLPHVLRDEVEAWSKNMDRLLGATHLVSREVLSGSGLDVWQDEDGLHVELEVPGLSHDDLEVTVSPDRKLLIQGERPAFEKEGVRVLRRERPTGRFQRVIELSEELDNESISANLRDGLLSVRVPVLPKSKPRKIEIQIG